MQKSFIFPSISSDTVLKFIKKKKKKKTDILRNFKNFLGINVVRNSLFNRVAITNGFH